MRIETDGIYGTWKRLLKELTLSGRPASPRGRKTIEHLGVTIRVGSGLSNIMVDPIRNLNYRFMVAEWLWITRGCGWLNEIAQYNSNLTKFSDDGETLSGAYGPRLMPQILDKVIPALKNDPLTRQAVAVIWTQDEPESKDVPCTVSCQFLLRSNVLNLIVTMRSSDIWLGLPYDFFVFSQLLNSVAGVLGAHVGFVQFNLGSSHLYMDDFDKAIELLRSEKSGYSLSSPALRDFPPDDLYRVLMRPKDVHLIQPQPWEIYATVLMGKREDALNTLTTKS